MDLLNEGHFMRNKIFEFLRFTIKWKSFYRKRSSSNELAFELDTMHLIVRLNSENECSDYIKYKQSNKL